MPDNTLGPQDTKNTGPIEHKMLTSRDAYRREW
jgi:hypothetical protein